MPAVRTQDVNALVSKAIKVYEKSKGLAISSDFEKNFKLLAKEVNHKNNLSIDKGIKWGTLYRNMYLRVKRETSDKINFSQRYLDALSMYANGEGYFHVYGHSVKSYEMPQQKLPKIGSKEVIIFADIAQKEEAHKVFRELENNDQIHLSIQYRDCSINDELISFYKNLKNESIIISLIDVSYFMNENCVRQLVDLFFSEDSALKEKYLTNTIHLFLDKEPGTEFNLFETSGRCKLLKYWKEQVKSLEDVQNDLVNDVVLSPIIKLEKDIKNIKGLIEWLYPLLTEILSSKHILRYALCEEIGFDRLKNLVQLSFVKSASLESTDRGISESTDKLKHKKTPIPKGVFLLYHFDEEKTRFQKSVAEIFENGELVIKGSSGTVYHGRVIPKESKKGIGRNTFTYFFYKKGDHEHPNFEGVLHVKSHDQIIGVFNSNKNPRHRKICFLKTRLSTKLESLHPSEIIQHSQELERFKEIKFLYAHLEKEISGWEVKFSQPKALAMVLE